MRTLPTLRLLFNAKIIFRKTILIFFPLSFLSSSVSSQIVRSGTDAGILIAIDQFRSDLGVLNPNVPGSLGGGRREINWDGVPDAFAAPNNLPATFFNVNSPRGVVLSTPGSGFQVSANVFNPYGAPIEFGNINPTYPILFAPFSLQRLFTPLGSNITDVTFFVPGSTTPALVRGFGAVFSDVNIPNITSIQLFGANNDPLGIFFVPFAPGNETFSFLGISYATSLISRVRITSGTSPLGPNETGPIDLVVMDDFIFGEPIALQVLPVYWKSVTATRKNTNVTIIWETATEQHNKGFNIQRNGGGGWETVAFVPSKATGGNSTAILSYAFNDVNTSRGVTQYRVQQVDIDGKSTYSEIRPVRGEGLANRLLVYPNPSNSGSVNVVFDDQNTVRDVLVWDISGRPVKQYKEVSTNMLVINDLMNGVYNIQVTDRKTLHSVFENIIIRR